MPSGFRIQPELFLPPKSLNCHTLQMLDMAEVNGCLEQCSILGKLLCYVYQVIFSFLLCRVSDQLSITSLLRCSGARPCGL